MISIINGSITVRKMSDRPVVSLRIPGVSGRGTGLSGVPAGRLATCPSLANLGIRERGMRPTEALEAVAAKARTYAFTAAGAGSLKQTQQHHSTWAFRGPDPWSEPA